MKNKIVAISPDDTLAHWTTVSKYLSRVIEHGQGESNLTDYLRKCLNGMAQCWLVIDENSIIIGVGLTEFLQYSRHKTLHIIAFAGDNFNEQAGVFPTIVEYAKNNNCKSIEQWGRKGWAKTLPKYLPDFKEVYTVMRMDL